MNKLLECQSVSRSYADGNSTIDVLHDVSFTIAHGEQVAILGSSGSGKSTLLHILGALDNPNTGDVVINGQSISSLSNSQQADFRNQTLGFVYQFHHLLPEFSAIENVAMPLLIAGIKPADAALQSEKMLSQVNLQHRLTHKPAELSGGERQRVAIARALINQPQLVLADEPTGNLDKNTGVAIAELLAELRENLDTAFVIVTHDIEFANQFDRIFTLSDGHLAVTK
jgi:lipoprotein-releasing system ATP-binding protein